MNHYPIHPAPFIEEQFRIVANTLPVMIRLAGTDKRCNFFNTAWLRFTGCNPEQEKGNGWTEGIHPADLQEYLADYAASFDKREEFKIEYRLKHQNGAYRWIMENSVPCYVEGDVFAGYISSCVDIEDIFSNSRFQNEFIDTADLQKDQAMLAAIIESSEDVIVSKTLEGIITSWNKSAERVFGYTEEETIGKHISLIIPHDRIDEERVIIEKIKNNESIDHFETIRMAKHGRLIPISLTVSPIRDRNGHVIGASKIARDISRAKEAEAQLQKYAEMQEILNNVGRVISTDLDVQGILQKVTDATTQLTGASFGAFFHNVVNEKGESYMLYTLSGAPREAFEKFGMPRNTAVFEPTFSGTAIVRVDDITKDPRYGHNAPNKGMPKGHLPVVSYLAVPVVSKTGEVIGGLFFGHTEPGKFTREHENLVASVAAQAAAALDNAKLYQEIKQLNSKKDEFIGMASHELKTPVTSIKGYLQIVRRDSAIENKTRMFLDKTLQQVDKLSALVADLLDVSKIQSGKLPLVYSTFDVNTVLRDVSEMMGQSNPSHHIELELEDNPLIIDADQQRIEQVIINLVSNAIKYSPKASRLIVKSLNKGDKIQVVIQDFGIGIEQAHFDRIFSRFYRVENLAAHISGLGIGLYITQEIITRHNGKLWVTSTPGEGSKFYFELPKNANADMA